MVENTLLSRRRAGVLLHPSSLPDAGYCGTFGPEARRFVDLIAAAGVDEEIDLLSIDIDGNDYWVWKALSATRPKVVIVETHVEFGLRNIVAPYDPEYVYPGKHPQYHGASPVAMARG